MSAVGPYLVGTFGAEEFLDAIEAVLVADLNAELARVYERMAPADMARAARRQLPYVPMEVAEVPPEHFYVGNFPSQTMEEVSPEMYPYVVLAVEDMVPDAESARHDQVSVFRQALAIHSLAGATMEEGSEVVYRRAIRMAVAVHNVLASNLSTARLLKGMTNPTRGQSSIPWTYREKGRNDQKGWFQAVGLSYAAKAYRTQYD